MKTIANGDSLICIDTETIHSEVEKNDTTVSSSIHISGEWSIEIPRLVGAVGEDPELTPEEKEHSYNSTKDDDEFKVNVGIRGPMQRYLGTAVYGDFDLTELRVNTEDAKGKQMKPHHFSGGTITAVEGYIPLGQLKKLKETRSGSSHANVVSREMPTPSSDDPGTVEADNDDEETTPSTASNEYDENDDPDNGTAGALSW